MNPPLHHFYHCFADGDWLEPVTDHFEALTRFGLAAELASCHVGFVGSAKNIAAAKRVIRPYVPGYLTCAKARKGFEQVTLDSLYAWVQDHDGLVSYAHTKGAANYAAVNTLWRRSMEYHNFVEWRRPVEALTTGGKSIAGCHWMSSGAGGMFGGNYWWTRCELLRQNVPPDHSSRHAAEHWLGQLSDVMPINPETIEDLNPKPIGTDHAGAAW